MIDEYEVALHHLHAAMAAMDARRDTLALATIAHAASVVAAGSRRGVTGAMADAANRLPC